MIVGSLALGSHLFQQVAIRNNQGLAEVINVSGRQRMLSQRIASLAAQYRLGDPSARQSLLTAIAEFEAAHQTLSRAYLAASGTGSAPLLHRLYFEGSNSIDAQMTAFVRTARQVASMPASDSAQPALLAAIFQQAQAPLLNDLDHVVAVHQRESESRLAYLMRLQWILLAIMLLTLALEARYIYGPMIRRIVSFSAEILRLATTDALTAVANRRGFLEQCNMELERTCRYNHPLSLLILDIDHFKQINDRYGHAAGDHALKVIANSLQANLRPRDVLGRIGGEEFAILVPETSLHGAVLLAERLRREIAACSVQFEQHAFVLTISIGVSEVQPVSAGVDTALQMADRLLYQAKQSGRNQVASSRLGLVGA